MPRLMCMTRLDQIPLDRPVLLFVGQIKEAKGVLDIVDATVVDLGTGSGVLAMAAALMGARSVIGLDIDQDAIDSAETSARLNTLPDSITFTVTDFRTVLPTLEDVFLRLTGHAIRD